MFWLNSSIRHYFCSNPNQHYLKTLCGIVSLQCDSGCCFMLISLRSFVSLFVWRQFCQHADEDWRKCTWSELRLVFTIRTSWVAVWIVGNLGRNSKLLRDPLYFQNPRSREPFNVSQRLIAKSLRVWAFNSRCFCKRLEIGTTLLFYPFTVFKNLPGRIIRNVHWKANTGILELEHFAAGLK